MLVTGGASGIGAAVAHRFRQDGARVAVLDRDRVGLERAAKLDLAPHLLLPGDVSDAGQVARAFDALDDVWGGIDVLCNSADVSVRQAFLDATPEAWRETLEVNLTGTFLVAQQAARRMVRGNGGAIVNIASVGGLVGIPNYAGHNVSKAAVIELTKTMALELAPAVRVNAVCPGYVLTPLQRAEYAEAALAECAAKVPLRRLADPAEIASAVAYLASPAGAFVTGHSFVIDGGETAGGLASS
ncbi:SDR family NAD(P)-dependent oxidoreductase [Streptomyces sp. NPDC050504]|uniref:SDR family NAD(P)-dependent oxidoreductase n=1 Tax=Streptomyces sp. NPDC050504 TaxID=3365618 RepID=UPI00379D8F3F